MRARVNCEKCGREGVSVNPSGTLRKHPCVSADKSVEVIGYVDATTDATTDVLLTTLVTLVEDLTRLVRELSERGCDCRGKASGHGKRHGERAGKKARVARIVREEG